MSYNSRVNGKLRFTVKKDGPTEWPADVQEAAERHGLNLPTLDERKGLSKAAVRKLKDSELRRFLQFTETGTKPSGESFTAYDIDDELREMLHVITKDDCLVKGTLYVMGEEQGDLQRFVFTGTTFRTERAKLVWPDGKDVGKEIYQR